MSILHLVLKTSANSGTEPLFNSSIANSLAIQRNYVDKLEIIKTVSFFSVPITLKRLHYASMFV